MKNKSIIQEEKMLFPIQKIVGYNIKKNIYVPFKIVSADQFNLEFYSGYNDLYNFCYINGNSIVFPKKSNCKKLYIF